MMKPEDTQDGTVTFMATVGFAILDLSIRHQVPMQQNGFRNHVAKG